MRAQESLVSVVMATYEGERYVADAIESVLAQTYRQIELIVVDDRSSDATPAIVERFATADPERVRLIRRPVNEGPCRARRIGFEAARGEFLCWIDQDDLWLPAKVEDQVAIMRERPDVGLVYTYFEAFNSDSADAMPWPDGRRDFQGDILAPLFLEGCFIGSITTMVRRSALATRGLRIRDRDFSFGDDYYLWMGIALDWQVARIPRVLARYRRHRDNESARLAQRNVDLWRVQLLKEFLAEYPDARRRLGRQRARALARHYLLAAGFEHRRGRWRDALQLALRALAEDPAVPARSGWGILSRR